MQSTSTAIVDSGRVAAARARGGNVRTIRMLRLLESLAFSEREF